MSGRRTLLAPRLFDGERLHEGPVAVAIDGVKIAALLAPAAAPEAEPLPEGSLLAPGFVDVQVNGGGGVLFNDEITPAALAAIARAHRGLGTTALLPTLMSAGTEAIAAAMAAVRAAMASGVEGIVGLHVEGPFFNPARKGIHPPAALRPITEADLAVLTAPFPAPLMLTLAPERVPLAAIARLTAAGVLVFAGHTEASAETIAQAREAGLAGFTHLFNAMPPFASRAPGPVGAAFAGGGYAGLIADGFHVHPAALTAVAAALGPGRVMLVSDAMPTAGSAITRFAIGGRCIRLTEGRLIDEAGTLAGAHLDLAGAVRRMAELPGVGRAAALRMATRTPAACLGLAGTIGCIAPGARADLVVLDGGGAVLRSLVGGNG